MVGRWIMMYLAEPADLLRRLPDLTRPGAVIAFQESADLTAAVEAVPPTPLHDQLARWTAPLAEGTGPIVNMGRRLYHTFLDAGLPAPQLRLEAHDRRRTGLSRLLIHCKLDPQPAPDAPTTRLGDG